MKGSSKKKVNQLSILNFVKVIPKQNMQQTESGRQPEPIDIGTDSERSLNTAFEVQQSQSVQQTDQNQKSSQPESIQSQKQTSLPSSQDMLQSVPSQFVIRPQTSPQINSPTSCRSPTSPNIDLSSLKGSMVGNESPGNSKFDQMNITQHYNVKSAESSKQTPAQKQYYALRDQLDSSTILFIQNGHFYELYDDDGCFAVEYLNLRGVKKSSGQFVAGVPMVEKVSFYFQKALLLGKNIAIAHQADEIDTSFKVQARRLEGIYSLSCQGFFDLEDLTGLLYVHQTLGDGTYVVFYEYLSNELYIHKINQGKTLKNELYEIILRIKPAELLINDDEQLRSEFQLLLSKQFNTLITSLPENHYQPYIQQSRFKNYRIMEQIDEIKQFKLLNDYLTYLNVYPGQNKEKQDQPLGTLKNGNKSFNLPFTTVQTLQLMDVKKVYSTYIQTTSGKLYLHNVFTVLNYDRELIKQNNYILSILNKDNNQIKFRSFLDVSGFKLNKFNNKHAFSIIQSIKQLKYYIDQAVNLFKLEVPKQYEYLCTLVDYINENVSIDIKSQQILMNEQDLKVLQQMELKYKEAQCKFINSLGIGQVTNPVFTGGYGSNAAKTALGFTPNNVLVIGRSIVDKNKINVLIQKLSNQDVMNSSDFIETLANCHKFTMPQYLVNNAEEIEHFTNQNLNNRIQQIINAISGNKLTLQKLYQFIGRIDFLQAVQKLKNQYSNVSWCVATISDQDESNQFNMEQFTHIMCLQKQDFVPLSFTLKQNSNVLTGPNMSGKSTLLRAICLSLLLSQAGVYVPAKQLNHSLIHQLLARVGGYDLGNSTFQTEMIDTAQILSLCGSKSVVVLDEVGRGTETISSDAISQGILKFLMEKQSFSIISSHSQQMRLCAHTLNSGVYYMDWDFTQPEIVEEQDTIDSQEHGKRIHFKYTVVPVMNEHETVKSMGCEVAEIAGVNHNIIERAKYLRSLMEHAVQQECERCVKSILNV